MTIKLQYTDNEILAAVNSINLLDIKNDFNFLKKHIQG